MYRSLIPLCLLAAALHAEPRREITAEEFSRALKPPKVRSFPLTRGPEGVTDDYPSVEVLIHFATDSDVIENDSHTSLREIAKALRTDLADVVLVVAGHTDSDGTDDYNLLLSHRRAHAVRRFLTDEGVDGRRLRVEACGETRPVADNLSAEGKAANRRVEFIRVGWVK